MNVRDSEVIAGLLKADGWTLVDDFCQADVIIFNTCSVRQHAEEKVWSEIGRISKLRARFKKTGGQSPKNGDSPRFSPIIGLVGCMAQNYKEWIFKRSPQVDFVVGPADIAKIPEIVSKLTKQGDSPLKAGTVPDFYERKIWETDSHIRPEEIYHSGFHEDKEHAYVVISEGCSNYCSYCVVPFVRGELHNRNYQDILKEIEEAVVGGITKITLLGQNVNAYQSPCEKQGDSPQKTGTVSVSGAVNFPQLLAAVNKINGIKEFSFVTSHPKDTSEDLFKAMAECEKLNKQLHLPLQSGSDRILKLMNRGYTRDFYLDLAQIYRKIVKAGTLTTDIILGFPSETEEDFQNTYDLVKEIKFNAAYIFKYSPRPHTTAEKMLDDVPKEEKERRHQLILELQKKISKRGK